jgi:demethylmenaquinone methyltransferase/2-methoxy-6-polyprenyl-1,4-benzoquinol methylase
LTYHLPSNSEKAEYVNRKFDEIASKYDRFNDLITLGMHRYWKRFVARQTGLQAGESCLDLCCGTGDIARVIIQQHPKVEVTGVDFAASMLNVAADRTQDDAIHWIQGDALHLPFPDDRFAAVTIGYGLRNLDDLTKGLLEIRRILQPGGVLVSLDVGKVRLPLLDTMSRFYFFRMVPKIGEWLMPGQEMFTYLPQSSLKYPDQETLKRKLLEVGFQQADFYDFLFGASTIHVAYKTSAP